ncbi:MAG: tetratricopeptide repeat protein [Pirellulaceae bacterium]
MGLFDWFTGKRTGEKSRLPQRPEVTESFGSDSPFISYVANGMFVMTDRDTFDYQFSESALPNPTQRDLDEVLPKVTRVRALSGGIFRGAALESPVLLDTSDTDALSDFRQCFGIIEDPSTFGHCSCLGGPTLELFAGRERIATIGLQHGRAIRWKQWKHDAALRNGQLLTTWLTDHGLYRKLLDLLYHNPFPFTGGRVKGSMQRALSGPEQRLFLADIHCERGDPGGALTECDEVLALNPRLGKAYATRGFIRSRQGDYESCVADCTFAIECGDLRADVFFGRAVAFDYLGRHGEAIADCTTAIELDAEHANSYNSRGLARMKVGQFDEALADLNTAIRLAPEWELPHINRAQLAHIRRDWEAAVSDYTCAIDKIQACDRSDESPMLARLYWNRAESHRSRGNLAAAEADRREAIRRDPTLGGQ